MQIMILINMMMIYNLFMLENLKNGKYKKEILLLIFIVNSLFSFYNLKIQIIILIHFQEHFLSFNHLYIKISLKKNYKISFNNMLLKKSINNLMILLLKYLNILHFIFFCFLLLNLILLKEFILL